MNVYECTDFCLSMTPSLKTFSLSHQKGYFTGFWDAKKNVWMKITCLIFGPYLTMQSMGRMDEFVQTDQALGKTK